MHPILTDLQIVVGYMFHVAQLGERLQMKEEIWVRVPHGTGKTTLPYDILINALFL